MTATLDIVLLRTVVAIDDCGGFGRAAEELRISQPTVSQHVRSLERRLGQALVEKDGRRSRFTPAGAALLAEARRIIAVHDQALERLDVSTRPPLAVGASPVAVETVLPGLVDALRDAHPDRPVQVTTDRSAALTQGVRSGALDLALVFEVSPAGEPPTEDGALEVGHLRLIWRRGLGSDVVAAATGAAGGALAAAL